MCVYACLTERWLIRTDLESAGREKKVPICKVDVCACIIGQRGGVQRGQVEQMVS